MISVHRTALLAAAVCLCATAAPAFDKKLSQTVANKAASQIQRCGDNRQCMAGALVEASKALGRRPDYKGVQQQLMRVARALNENSSQTARQAAQAQKKLARHRREEVKIFSALFTADRLGLN